MNSEIINYYYYTDENLIQSLKENIKKNNLHDTKQILDIMYDKDYKDNKRSRLRGNEDLSYSIPNMSIICSIVEFLNVNYCSQIIEIGAGTGLWASLIQNVSKDKKYDINFIATDKFDVGKGLYGYKYTYTNVENMDALHAIEKYKNSNCLFLCWPPSQEMVEKGEYSAGEVLKVFKGDYLISIGENSYGDSTGDNLFYDELHENWIHLEDEDIDMTIILQKLPRRSINDSICFYKRKEPKPIRREDVIRNIYLLGSVPVQ